MGDTLIGAALAGQQVTASEAAAAQQAAAPQQEQAQPQVNYVTSEQLNASMDEIKRMIQSSTDKSYNRVQKMIAKMQQAGIQNPTEAQARAMLAMQEQSEAQNQQQPEAQSSQGSAVNPEAAQWIRQNGGDPTLDYWMDIYDAAQEAGVPMITRDDPEFEAYFMEDGKAKVYAKPRQFVRAFENALSAKKQRIGQQGASGGNLASSPALGAGGARSTFVDPKKTTSSDLITQGLKQYRR